MAFPEGLAVDNDGTRWWDSMVARTLSGFDAADRCLLNELLKPLIREAIDAQAEDLGKLGTLRR
jgi:hypothetical protein